jgi:hypothetical protein
MALTDTTGYNTTTMHHWTFFTYDTLNYCHELQINQQHIIVHIMSTMISVILQVPKHNVTKKSIHVVLQVDTPQVTE